MPRNQAHYQRYGQTETPPRGTGHRMGVTRRTVENLSTASKVLGLLAGAAGLYLLWKKK